MDLTPDDIPSLAAALTGVWNVVRRGAEPQPRFRRVTFYRDGRFGTRSVDGRTTQYGNWQLGVVDRARRASVRPEPVRTTEQGVTARLSLRFDHHAGPSGDYRIRMIDPPLGPMVWEDADVRASRVALVRAGAVDAALVGVWLPLPGEPPRGPAGVVALDLRADGHYVMTLTGGVSRPGAWEFEREATFGIASIDGVLRLDPVDEVFPDESWITHVRDGWLLSLEQDEGAGVIRMRRRALDSWSRQLIGSWRFVAPAGAPVPQEIHLRPDGSLEILARPGLPRGHGRWGLHSIRRHPNALEGTLSMETHLPGRPSTREQWRILLPHGRGAELRIFSADGRHSLHYRRLFR